MDHCEEFGIRCYETEYALFDSVCSEELRSPPSVNEIINTCEFCTVLPLEVLDAADGADVLTLNDHLARLENKSGIYHLWISVNKCADHKLHSLLGVYVGKGQVKRRVLSHIKEKWPRSEFLWISFYECNNRLSKYLEQLFLDTYSFHLNTQENTGRTYLYARWPETRVWHGTEFDHHVQTQSERIDTDG